MSSLTRIIFRKNDEDASELVGVVSYGSRSKTGCDVSAELWNVNIFFLNDGWLNEVLSEQRPEKTWPTILLNELGLTSESLAKNIVLHSNSEISKIVNWRMVKLEKKAKKIRFTLSTQSSSNLNFSVTTSKNLSEWHPCNPEGLLVRVCEFEDVEAADYLVNISRSDIIGIKYQLVVSAEF